MLCAALAMLGLTVASSLEMFALGYISEKGQESLVGKVESQVNKNPIDSISHFPLIKKALEKLPMQTSSDLIKIVPILLILIGLKALALFYSRYATTFLSVAISKDLRQRYFEHLQALPMQFYQKHNIGMIASRVGTDALQIANSINALITNYFHTPFRILLTLGICFYISWQLSLVIFVGLPLIVIPVLFLTKKVKNITRQLQKNQEKFTTVLIDFLAGIQTVKIFSMEAFTLKKYKEQNDLMADLEIRTARYDLLIRPTLHTITMMCALVILVFGLYALKMSLSQLLMFCGFLHQFYEPVKKFSEENTMIQKGVVAAERLYEVLRLEPHEKPAFSLKDLFTFSQSIDFKNVWFKYEDEWVLKDVSFSIRKGESVAIVGATGAGKSTMVNLLPRLYDIQQGEISIDGIGIKEISKTSLRELFSFVPQKPFLFFDTVKANINYGQPFSEERIKEAAKKAQAEEFIQNLPLAYDTVLAEAGKSLSGGQQQRLAIARALAKQAPILILDEATSSLDALSENLIKKAVKQLQGSMTQIIIAHRLSTIQHVDKILFLDKGRLVAEGTKETLLKECPLFAHMWKASFHEAEEKDHDSAFVES